MVLEDLKLIGLDTFVADMDEENNDEVEEKDFEGENDAEEMGDDEVI